MIAESAGFSRGEYVKIYARARNLTNQDYGHFWGGNIYSPKRFFQVGATCRF